MVSQEAYDGVLDYFHFWPSRSLAIVGLTLFLFFSLVVLATTIKTRCWYMLVATGVGLLEMAGFACRVRMFKKPEYGVFVAMQCLLIIPPSFLALLQYITLGKVVILIQNKNPEVRLPLRGRLIMWVYFAAEIGSLALQGAGAGLSVSPDDAPQNSGGGQALLIVGLALLVVLIFIYLLNAVYVHSSRAFGVRQSRALTYLFYTLYVSTVLLLTRNIFRLIEFADGWYGSIATREVYFYTLDSLLILLVIIVSGVFNFGFFFNAYSREQDVAVKAQHVSAEGYPQAGVAQTA